MPRAHTPGEKRKALRSFKQRGYVVQPKAMQIVLDAYDDADFVVFSDYLDKVFEHLSRPGATQDSIVTAVVAAQITARIASKERNVEDGVIGTGAAEGFFEVIDAFDVPFWLPDSKSAGVRFTPNHGGVAGKPESKAQLFRSRYELVRSKTLRNEQFTPPASSILARGKSPYLQLTGIESLAGTRDDRLVLGMLAQLEEGSWYLEDLHGNIKLDISDIDTTAGLFTENSFVIAQGRHIELENGESIFKVSVMGMPPRERREDSLATVGKASNLFGGNFDNSDMETLLARETREKGAMILILSDLHLDDPQVIASFRHILEGYLEDNVVPAVVILMGNFLSHTFGREKGDLDLLTEKFTELGEMIARDFETIANSTMFVLVPSLSDPGPGLALPRPPMPAMLTAGFVNTIGKERVFLGSNPCRIRYMTQELVIMREDMLEKMLRHCCVPPNMDETNALPEHLLKTVLDQAHLIPLPISSRPIVWNHDQALWLFPTPHVLVLSDKVPSYSCHYGQTNGINPGVFASDFSFVVYLPSERKAQLCSLTSERVPAEEEISKTPPPLSEDESENSNSDSGHCVNSLRATPKKLDASDDESNDARDQNIDILLNVTDAKPLQETGPVIGDSQTQTQTDETNEGDTNDVEMKAQDKDQSEKTIENGNTPVNGDQIDSTMSAVEDMDKGMREDVDDKDKGGSEQERKRSEDGK